MNFRVSETSGKKKMLAGKDAKTNENLVGQAGSNEYVLHTASPGSPFVNIKADKKDTSRQELKEAAVFCAKFSQAWKKAKIKPKEVEVHYFLGKDIFKTKDMKLGTFGVRNHKKIKVKKEEIEK